MVNSDRSISLKRVYFGIIFNISFQILLEKSCNRKNPLKYFHDVLPCANKILKRESERQSNKKYFIIHLETEKKLIKRYL